MEAAARIAFEKGLTVHDAAYATLAELEAVKLLTYNGDLLEKLEHAVAARELLRSLHSKWERGSGWS